MKSKKFKLLKIDVLMKVVLTMSFLFLLNCTSFKKKEEAVYQLSWNKIVDGKLRIIKIVEKRLYFIIYVKNNGDVFKVMSMKEDSEDEKCRKIKLNRVYKFRINPIFNHLHSGGFFIDNEPVYRKEGDSIENLYKTEYLKGLCIQKI